MFQLECSEAMDKRTIEHRHLPTNVENGSSRGRNRMQYWRTKLDDILWTQTWKPADPRLQVLFENLPKFGQGARFCEEKPSRSRAPCVGERSIARGRCRTPNQTNARETEEDPFLNKQTFYLVAQNVAGLKKLSLKLSKKKGKNKKSVKSVVSRLLLKSRSVKNPDVYRGSLYNQWREPINSDPAFVEVSKNYWLTKATKDVDTEPTEAISEATPSESQAIDQPRQPELGKRTPRKRQQTTDNAEVSSLSAEEPEAENEDVSDWEQSRKPKRPRPFRVKRKFIRRTKKQLEFDRQNCSAGNDPEKKTRGRKRTSLPQTDTGLKNGWKSIYAQKPMELFDEPYTPSMETINIADIKTEDETERGAAPISTEWGPLAPVTLAPVPKSAVSSNALGDGNLLELGTVIKREKSPGSGPDVGQGPASLLPALKSAAQGSGPSKVQPRTHFITGNPKIPVSKQGPSNQHVAQRGPLNLSASRSATNSRKPSVNKIQTESTGNTFYQNPFLTNTPCKPFRAPTAQHSFPSLPHRNIGPALPRMRGGCHPATAPFLVSRGAGHFVQQQPWVPEYRPKPSTSGVPNLAQYHRINVPAQHNVFLQGPLCFIPAVSGGDVVILASNSNAPVPQMPVPQYQLKPHPDLFVKHVPKPSAVPRVHQNMVFQVASNPVKAAPSAPVLPVPTELFLNVPIAPTRSHDVPASQTNAPPPLIEPKDVSLAYWVADFAKAFHPMDFGICWAATDFSQILV
ncbi:unnamed protein product [Nesidiocoris tenuis]|uniref:Uncharacterized protein n=1 Tax=Nesidiocoris tenuis TaxID=355587 RepID=A0A6H5H3N1_9HEMI|nr:unnamed protein product [Nesidiocoris tenuis]